MKDVLVGIQEGLIDGGVEVVTNFPGFKSHVLFSKLGGKITSVNEKIAYEIAWGASYAGKRSAVMFKNVGLNDAADPFLNSHLVGVNAGLVVIVFDDVEVEGSQSRQDSRHYFDFFEGLWLEPDSVEQAYILAYHSFEWSEKFKLPVVIRVTNQLINASGTFTRMPSTIRKVSVTKKDRRQFLIHPTNASHQRQELAKKNKRIRDFVENLYESKVTRKNGRGAISFGRCARELNDFNKEDGDILRIFTYPIPERRVKEFAKGKEILTVFEQGDNFGEEKIRAALEKQETTSNTGIIPNQSGKYIISEHYEKLFRALKAVEPDIVIGDLGEYTQDTLESIDACLCFGSSLSVGAGALIGGAKKVFSITGDAAYLHSGKNVIPEILERKIPLKVIVICNSGSQGTGGQHIPGDLFYQPEPVEKYSVEYRKTGLNEFVGVLAKMSKSKSLSVLYVSM
uniref:Thiamine pyrophosphate enzyme TPP-binding domain-containing protein n=1 Tax=candidate division WWE3 bacterium TaxID=2053526 RepID=A0A831YSJ1_UNCKA